MADSKVSALPAVSSLTGTELLYVVQSGTSKQATVSQLPTGAMAVGGSVSGGTAKSVLFVDGSGNLAQDNANFNYDSSTQTLTLGRSTSGSPANDGLLLMASSDGSGGTIQWEVGCHHTTAHANWTYSWGVREIGTAYPRFLLPWNSENVLLSPYAVGSVGIGTDAPGSRLTVVAGGGTIYNGGISINDGTADWRIFGASSATSPNASMRIGPNGTTTGWAWQFLHASSGICHNFRSSSDNAGQGVMSLQGVASQTGPLLTFLGIDSTSTVQYLAVVDGKFSSNTHASYKGQLQLGVCDASSPTTPRMGVSIATDGSNPLLQFFGTGSEVAQQTAGGVTAGFTAHASANAVFNESTWTGNVGSSAYTFSDIVAALKNLGLLAQ